MKRLLMVSRQSVCLSVCLVLAASTAGMVTRSSALPVDSYAPVVEKVSPSVVTILSTKTIRRQVLRHPLFDDPTLRRFFGAPEGMNPRGDGSQRMEGLGSGVIVSSDGYIVTNNHVVEGADEIVVQFGVNESEHPAKIVGTDPKTDLAVLKIEGRDFPALPFGNSATLKVGDVVLALGSPFGLRQSVSLGIVSALGRGSMGLTSYGNFIQTDAAINMGNSGGPLVDTEGKLVGINTAIHSRSGGSEGIGFCVPSNLVSEIYEKLKTNGKVSRGYMGINLQELSEPLAKRFGIPSNQGVLVADVVPGNPAAKAGVKNGDVIVAINGKDFSNPEQLRLFVASLTPGTKVDLKLIRQGKPVELSMTLGELPEDNGVAAREPGGEEDVPNVLDGITVGDLTPPLRQQLNLKEDVEGAVITKIDPESEGYQAGLREGDVVVEVNQTPVRNADEAVEASRKIQSGEDALLRVANARGIRYVVVKGS